MARPLPVPTSVASRFVSQGLFGSPGRQSHAVGWATGSGPGAAAAGAETGGAEVAGEESLEEESPEAPPEQPAVSRRAATPASRPVVRERGTSNILPARRAALPGPDDP